MKINKIEVLQLLKSALEDGYEGYYQDMIAEVIDPNVNFTREKDAVIAIRDFGVKRAYSLVSDYEVKMVKETAVSNMDTKTLAKKVFLIYAKELLDELFGTELKGLASQEKNKQLIRVIKRAIEQ
jgi:hypothetical protein